MRKTESGMPAGCGASVGSASVDGKVHPPRGRRMAGSGRWAKGHAAGVLDSSAVSGANVAVDS
ncbi:MAG: hypothetical protein AAGJ11_19700, partial [Bacteroidota bacterium]